MITIGEQRACEHGRWDPMVDNWRRDLREWIVHEIDKRGRSLNQVADELNGSKVPTLGGGEEWRPTSVRSLYLHPVKNLGGGWQGK